MNAFNRDRSGGGRSFGGNGGGGRSFGGGYAGGGSRGPSRGGDRGGRSFDRPEMHKAICDDCGEQCEVPFRPTGEKPVFCRDCFNQNNGGKGAPSRGGNDSFRENRREAPREAQKDVSKEQFEMLNAKLDKILKLVTPVIAVSKTMQKDVEEAAVLAEKPKSKAKKTAKKK